MVVEDYLSGKMMIIQVKYKLINFSKNYKVKGIFKKSSFSI